MKRTTFAMSLLGFTIFSGCANTQAITRKYDLAIEEARQDAETQLVADEEPLEATEFNDLGYLEGWALGKFNLKWSKRASWPRAKLAAASNALAQEFNERLLRKYPYEDAGEVSTACISAGKDCTWEFIELKARESHNAHVREALERRIAGLDEARQREIAADKNRIKRVWLAFAIGLQGMGRAMQQNTYQPMPAYQPTYEPASNVYPTRSIGSISPSPTSYTRIGNTTFGSDGTSYTRLGNTTFGSDGTSYTKLGNTTFGSDGTSYTRLGNTTFGSDGTSATRLGNTTFGSDGSSCTRLGSTTFCN